jgi:hypothetical protein
MPSDPVDTAEASARSRRSRRTTILVVLAVLVALIAIATAVIALTGGSIIGLGTPAATSTPVTATTTSTPTAVPTSTPRPTEPPAPAAPVVRVPATCEQLLPQSVAEAIVGGPLAAFSGSAHTASPMSFVGDRVGQLGCAFSETGGSVYDSAAYEVGITVVPDVSDEAFEQTVQREGIFVGTPEPSIGPDTYSACVPSPGTRPNSCSFIAHVGGYGVSLSSAFATTITEQQMAETRARFVDLRAAIEELGEPGALWQPDGPRLRGASDCAGLIDPAELAAALGIEAVEEYKSAEGEYNGSPFFADEQVGAYYCSWTDADRSAGVGASIAVLPGGAVYREEGLTADPDLVWSPAPDYPGEAAISVGPDASQVSLAIDGGWLTVTAPSDALHAVTDIALRNQGVALD